MDGIAGGWTLLGKERLLRWKCWRLVLEIGIGVQCLSVRYRFGRIEEWRCVSEGFYNIEDVGSHLE